MPVQKLMALPQLLAFNFQSKIRVLLYYYRDIIMLLHKLDQFYSDKEEDDTIKLICGDIEK